jgi:hypothetical protein
MGPHRPDLRPGALLHPLPTGKVFCSRDPRPTLPQGRRPPKQPGRSHPAGAPSGPRSGRPSIPGLRPGGRPATQALFDLEDGPRFAPETALIAGPKPACPWSVPQALAPPPGTPTNWALPLQLLQGRPLKVVDGSALTLTDTSKNRAAYLPIEPTDTPTSPVAPGGALLATERTIRCRPRLSADLGTGLAPTLAAQLAAGDILVGDRGFGSFPVIVCSRWPSGRLPGPHHSPH